MTSNSKKMATVPTVRLNSGEVIPVIGLGTAGESRPAEELAEVFVAAMEAGYRHFDTAARYGTEQPLGEAIREALRRGIIRSRDELFITSKLQCTDNHADLVVPAVKRSLHNLGVEYLNLYLIHWPIRLKQVEIMKVPFPKEDILPFDMKSTWEAMEDIQRQGLVKSIGVSNFSTKKLSELIANATILPAVNQVEMNTSWHQTKLSQFCLENGIHITAWSPLGGRGTSWGSSALLETPVIKEIAYAMGKTPAQIALRWLYEQGVSFVAKSFDKERMKENLRIFGWELSEEDQKKIDGIKQVRLYRGLDFTSPNGPYRTIEELWDGEI